MRRSRVSRSDVPNGTMQGCRGRRRAIPAQRITAPAPVLPGRETSRIIFIPDIQTRLTTGEQRPGRGYFLQGLPIPHRLTTRRQYSVATYRPVCNAAAARPTTAGLVRRGCGAARSTDPEKLKTPDRCRLSEVLLYVIVTVSRVTSYASCCSLHLQVDNITYQADCQHVILWHILTIICRRAGLPAACG